MDNKAALINIDSDSSLILRGFAILMVVLGHTGYIVMGGAGGVALFLLLSGYGLNLSCEKNGLAFYWNKRIRKVWLPCAIVGAFNVLALGIHSWPQRLCMVSGLDLNLNADKTMWYVSFILMWYLVYYLVFALSSPVKNKVFRTILRLIALFAAVRLFRFLYYAGAWSRASVALYYFSIFPIGVLLSCLSRIRVHENVRQLFWLAILFLSSAFMFRIYTQETSTPLALAMAFQLISASQLMRFKGRIGAVLSWFGKYSYPIYLFEGTLLLVRNKWFYAFGSQLMIDIVYLAVCCAFAFVFWEAAYSRFEKMLPLDRLIKF